MKKSLKTLFAEYDDKTDCKAPTNNDRAMNEAMSALEDTVPDDLFWKILHSFADVIDEQKRLAFTAGYGAGAKATA
jgi:hypothetical protein